MNEFNEIPSVGCFKNDYRVQSKKLSNSYLLYYTRTLKYYLSDFYSKCLTAIHLNICFLAPQYVGMFSP